MSMKHAKTDVDPSWKGLAVNEQIRVTNGCDKTQIGSCNACTDRDSYEKVTEVQLRGMSFRLCERCKVELVGLLKPKRAKKKFDPLDHNQLNG